MKRRILFAGKMENKLCECGCGKNIPFKKYHINYNVRFISGHKNFIIYKNNDILNLLTTKNDN